MNIFTLRGNQGRQHALKLIRKLLAALLVVLCTNGNGRAQLLYWDPNGTSGTAASINSAYNDPHVSASTLSMGSGITPAGIANTFQATGFATTLTSNDYFEFTVSPAAGYTFSASSLNFYWLRNSNGPTSITLRSSVDGYTADLATQTGLTNGAANQTMSFSGFSLVSVPVTFRLFIYGAGTSTGTGGVGYIAPGGAVLTVNGSTAVICSNTGTVTGSTAVCQNASSPQITFTGSGGTPPYTFTYNINGSGQTTVSGTGGNTTATVNAPTNSPGTFSYNLVSVQDANCTAPQSGSATVTVNPLPTATFGGTTSQTVCSGSTATFTVNLTGSGNYTVTYQYTNGSTVTATTVTVTGGPLMITVPPPSAAGTYTFTVTNVTDGNGCSNGSTSSASLKINPLPMATIAATGATTVCQFSAPPPQVRFTGAIGPPPYTFTYQVNSGPPTTVTTSGGNTSATVSQPTAVAGLFTYTLMSVSDANGCSQAQTGTVTIKVTAQVDATVQAFEVTCHGAANGKVYITGITGGTPPYQASIDGINYVPITGSPLTPAFSGLAPSTFNLYIKDAGGCVWPLAFITITEPPALSIIVTATASANCTNGTTTLTVNVTGGTPGMTTQGGTGSYTYQMDGGAQQFSNVFVAGIGNHTITVTDAAGCVTTTIASVTGGPVVINYTQAVSSTCFNGQTGQIGVSATGGAGDVNYILTKAGGSTSTLSGAQGAVVTFTGLGAGTYTITATAGCATTVTMSVTQPAQVKPPGTTNGAPDLLLNVVLSGSSFPTTASCVTATYTVSVKTLGGSNTAAQGVIVRVTKLSDVYTITLDPSSSGTWTEIANTNGYKEFQLKPGIELSCNGVGIPLVIRECRNGDLTKTTGAPGVASVRMPGATQDANTFDNVRASVFQAQ